MCSSDLFQDRFNLRKPTIRSFEHHDRGRMHICIGNDLPLETFPDIINIQGYFFSGEIHVNRDFREEYPVRPVEQVPVILVPILFFQDGKDEEITCQDYYDS